MAATSVYDQARIKIHDQLCVYESIYHFLYAQDTSYHTVARNEKIIAASEYIEKMRKDTVFTATFSTRISAIYYKMQRIIEANNPPEMWNSINEPDVCSTSQHEAYIFWYLAPSGNTCFKEQYDLHKIMPTLVGVWECMDVFFEAINRAYTEVFSKPRTAKAPVPIPVVGKRPIDVAKEKGLGASSPQTRHDGADEAENLTAFVFAILGHTSTPVSTKNTTTQSTGAATSSKAPNLLGQIAEGKALKKTESPFAKEIEQPVITAWNEKMLQKQAPTVDSEKDVKEQADAKKKRTGLVVELLDLYRAEKLAWKRYSTKLEEYTKHDETYGVAIRLIREELVILERNTKLAAEANTKLQELPDNPGRQEAVKKLKETRIKLMADFATARVTIGKHKAESTEQETELEKLKMDYTSRLVPILDARLKEVDVQEYATYKKQTMDRDRLAIKAKRREQYLKGYETVDNDWDE